MVRCSTEAYAVALGVNTAAGAVLRVYALGCSSNHRLSSAQRVRGGSDEFLRLPAGAGIELPASSVEAEEPRRESARSLAIMRFRWARSIPDILDALD